MRVKGLALVVVDSLFDLLPMPTFNVAKAEHNNSWYVREYLPPGAVASNARVPIPSRPKPARVLVWPASVGTQRNASATS